MPCQEFNKYQPPEAFFAGPFKTLEDCQAEPCGCQPCENCSWPLPRSQVAQPFPAQSGCFGFPFPVTIHQEQFVTSLPTGVAWKPGYPELIAQCNWRWWSATVTSACKNPGGGCSLISKTRRRLIVLKCDGSVEDITEQAATGTFESTSLPVENCEFAPEFPAYYDAPAPVCSP